MPSPKIITDFNPEWIQEYRKNVERLKRLGLPGVIAIYHIGGTAIKMRARPIIDILMIYKTHTDSEFGINSLKSSGFTDTGDNGIIGLRLLILPTRSTSLQLHLYIFVDGNPHIARFLLFRNYLRINKEAVEEYERSKAESLALKSSTFLSDPKLKYIKKIDRLALDSHEGPLPHWGVGDDYPFPFLTVEKLQNAIYDNLYFEMTFLSYYIKSSDVGHVGCTGVVCSDVLSDMYNYAVRSQIVTDVDSNVRRVMDVLGGRPEPFCWWIGPNDHPENLGERLLGFGLEVKASCYGMYMDLSVRTIDQEGLDDGVIKVVPIRTHEHLTHFDRVQVEAGVSTGVYHSLFSQCPTRLLAADSPLQGYVAYVNGVPVVTGLVVYSAEVAGLYHMATAASERHKGYGDIVIRYMLQRAKERRYRYVTILVEPQGQEVYGELGFMPLCAFQRYGPPA